MCERKLDNDTSIQFLIEQFGKRKYEGATSAISACESLKQNVCI